MRTLVITLSNGWTVVTTDGSVLRQLYKGDRVVEAKTPAKTYHIPVGSVVCVQEAEE